MSDRRERRIGFRTVKFDDFVMRVNDARLFLKGTTMGPTQLDIAQATPEQMDTDVRLVKDAGLDLLRLHAHVARPETYDAADRHGVLVWQDFPLHLGYARGTRKQASRQAREVVDLLGHHPAIAVWCGHDMPVAVDLAPGDDWTPPRWSGKTRRRYVLGQQLPTWNKTFLDTSVKRALERSDPTRPVVKHSGVLPHVGGRGTDSHLWFGWFHGDEDDLDDWSARVPNAYRFVGAFGAQAVPDSASAYAYATPEQWPDLDWDRLERDHSLQRALFEEHVPPSAYPTFEAWRDATQDYQALLLRRQIEALRRLKYRPTGGFCQFLFADTDDGITASVLDARREPKLGHAALTAACAPLLVVADRPEASYRPGAALALDVHVVSDLRVPVKDAEVTARLVLPDGSEPTWVWRGDIEADDCVRVGMVRAMLPEVEGAFELDLHLEAGDDVTANRYPSRISRTPGADGRMLP